MTTPPAGIASAFVAACRDELAAPKPGNVHRFADGHDMTAADFERSAEAAAPAIARLGAPVGARLLEAVTATRAAVAQNTNLGILLLCAPLAKAAESGDDLRGALAAVLESLDRRDAEQAFAAIALAAPGGLGRAARHDVLAPATVSLREAMREAAGRDRIARQYATTFDDVFDLGLPRLAAALRRTGDRELATTIVYLGFLAEFPDSHIVRKRGAAAADEVRRAAAPLDARLRTEPVLTGMLADLLAFDASLKARGLNPGTSADLTVATLFGWRLSALRRQP